MLRRLLDGRDLAHALNGGFVHSKRVRDDLREFFAGGGNAASLPQQPVGGDVIMLSPPKVDVDGNERPGITYNTKTKTLGRA